MTKVLILGAGGQIARWVIEMLADDRDLHPILYLRHKRKLHGTIPSNATVIVGDVLDGKVLDSAMQGQDIVYANLTGSDLGEQTKSILASMKGAGVQRLIFIASLGIYDESQVGLAHGIARKSGRTCLRSEKPQMQSRHRASITPSSALRG